MRTLFFLLLLTTHVFAQDVSVDRYTLVNPAASAEQKFPIIEVKTISISARVTTNSEAVDIVLTGTGYSQAQTNNRSQADLALMNKPLADINRQFTNMTVHEMLKAIAGVGYAPIIDPINRLVAFEITNEF